tara:strand:- start:2187 stop:2348 length:162 start_codon:yes stop_codon:yes gene_type:complete
MTVHEWLQEGIDKGYCSEMCCETHNPDYLTEQEAIDKWNGEDHCIFVVRILNA